MFTRFRRHWVETCHCAEFRFFHLTERASNWSAWNCVEFTDCFFCTSSQLSRLTGHWRALWPLWLQLLLEPTLVQHGELSSTLLSLTKDCHGSHWRNMTNWWTTHWGLINWLMRLFPLWKVWHQYFLDLKLQNSMTSSSSLSVSLPWSQTARNWKALLWALNGHQLTLVPGSMADGLYGLRYTIPTPESPCNSFALTTLHCRRCENWRSLKTAEILFPSCRLPHYSYTKAEFNCYRECRPENVEILTGVAFMGDVVTTGQTAQTVCFATTLRTATEILNTGVIPTSLFTKWTGELLVYS